MGYLGSDNDSGSPPMTVVFNEDDVHHFGSQTGWLFLQSDVHDKWRFGLLPNLEKKVSEKARSSELFANFIQLKNKYVKLHCAAYAGSLLRDSKRVRTE